MPLAESTIEFYPPTVSVPLDDVNAPQVALDPITSKPVETQFHGVNHEPLGRAANPQYHVNPNVPANLRYSTPAIAVDSSKGVIRTEAAEIMSKEATADPTINVVGWDADPENVPRQIVRGMENEELWMLVRRFNGQTHHVKAIPHTLIPKGRLDLEPNLEEEFSPDKLRTQVERLYYTVFLGMAAFAHHIVRLRSWNEFQRTAIWTSTYFIAWGVNLLWPLVMLSLTALIVHPPARTVFFPPPPPPVKSIKADSTYMHEKMKVKAFEATGTMGETKEKHLGEASEREASSFVNKFTNFVVGSALGKPHPEMEAAQTSKNIFKGPGLVDHIKDAVQSRKDHDNPQNDTSPGPNEEKGKITEQAWAGIRPAQQAIGDISDGWERFANALSPTLPFRENIRLRLAGIVLGLFFASLLLTPGMISRGAGFGVGFAFFGQPLIDRGIHWLNVNVPNWLTYLELRNTLLLGVPTNAQLTLTLLRLAEAEQTPLPPPPSDDTPENDDSDDDDYDYQDQYRDEHGTDLAMHRSSHSSGTGIEDRKDPKESKKVKVSRKLVGAMKKVAQTGVSTALSVDKVAAKVGNDSSKERLGALPGADDNMVDGPSLYFCRMDGKKGYLIINAAATTPSVSFVHEKTLAKDQAAFSVQLADITELKKVGGLGFITKKIVETALGKQVSDGLLIKDSLGEEFKLTAIHRRNELFNRLIAMTSATWESW